MIDEFNGDHFLFSRDGYFDSVYFGKNVYFCQFFLDFFGFFLKLVEVAHLSEESHFDVC